MSLESAKACLERIHSDEAFRQKVSAVEGEQARLAVCRDAGFEFSAEEFVRARADGSELTEDELDGVSGGCFVDGCNVDF